MLTTIENIRSIRDIAANLRDARLEPYLRECEETYIMPAITPALYEKLDNKTVTDEILMTGGYYDGPNGRAYCHGLRKATAYFAYARVLQNNQVNVTAFGVVQKTGSYSQPSDSQQVATAIADTVKMAEIYLHSCVEYLHRNDECQCGGKPHGRPSDYKLHVQVLS